MDFAAAGNIIYGDVNNKQFTVVEPTSDVIYHSNSIADGSTASDTGLVRGDIKITSGDVNLTSQATAATGSSSLTLGHERLMTNVTNYVGSEPDGAALRPQAIAVSL